MASTDDVEQRVRTALEHIAQLPDGSVGLRPAVSSRVRPPRRQPTRRLRLAALLVSGALLVAGVVRASSTSAPTTVLVRPAVEPPVPAGVSPPVTLPKVEHPAGWTPVDYGLVRLYLPPGWHTEFVCVTVHGGTSAVPHAFALVPPAPRQAICASPRSAEVVIGPLASPAPPTWSRSSVNGLADRVSTHRVGGTETVDLPTEAVQITARGDGRKLLATVGPSALQAVVDLSAPVRVPSAWKTVGFAGLTARVPPGWPVEFLGEGRPEPGTCDTRIFDTPQVDLGPGFSSATEACTLEFPQLFTPTYGLWITPGSIDLGNDKTRLRRSGSLTERIGFSDTDVEATVEMDVTVASRSVAVTIGLGVDPVIAEEVLSSIRSGAPGG